MLWRLCEHCEFKSSLCCFQVPFKSHHTFCISLNSESGKTSPKALAGTKEELLSWQTRSGWRFICETEGDSWRSPSEGWVTPLIIPSQDVPLCYICVLPPPLIFKPTRFHYRFIIAVQNSLPCPFPPRKRQRAFHCLLWEYLCFIKLLEEGATL